MTDRILMIRPADFGFNPETAVSNTFQQKSGSSDAHARALIEFEKFVIALGRAGVSVRVFDDTAVPSKPDAVFPNNWVSFHGDRGAVVYPMASPLRRNEVRLEIVEALGYRVALDLREPAVGSYLEGTGSLVLDRVNRLAFACRSPRTDEALVHKFCSVMGFESVVFNAFEAGEPIYHTNVMLAIGERLAVVCLEACEDPDFLSTKLIGVGKRLIEISADQMRQYSGNMLQLQNGASEAIWVMSCSAWNALDNLQRGQLEADGHIIAVELTTIETLSGGSARCMMAELY